MTTSNKSETFGKLLKGAINGIANYEGKTAPIVEEELGALIGISGKTIQRYKTGYLPPFDRDNDAVRVLAEAAVRRGFLGREWLERFLHAARYPAAEKLLDELCPVLAPRPKVERVYQNLPAPTYSHFVMRQQAFAEVTDGIDRRSAVVLIASLGGMGKTSLALEIANGSLRDDSDVPHFDAVVWVSDRDRPGTTNFSVVLDTIARTLDYPGFIQFAHNDKQLEVEQLLRRQRVLLVVDNFETITDGVLLEWLLRLPEPSKAIITTRQYRREFRNSAIVVDLKGMTDTESWELINERLQVLHLELLATNREQLKPLLVATGGNPKAIGVSMGLLKHERRPLQQIIDDLYAARGELFEDIFSRAWSLLDDAAKKLLLVTTFFVDSASSEALASAADVQGNDFDQAIELLTDLALLDVQQADFMSAPRYLLHPLVRAFAQAKLTERQAFEHEARMRFVQWYIDLATSVGYCWKQPPRLERLDPEKENLHDLIIWCFNQARYLEAVQLVDEVYYYYHVRGHWARERSIFVIGAQSAGLLGDNIQEAKMLAIQIKYASLRDMLDEEQDHFERILSLERTDQLPTDVWLHCQLATALYKMAREDPEGALEVFKRSLYVGIDIEDQHVRNALMLYATLCLLQLNRIEEARSIANEGLEHALQQDMPRGVVVHTITSASLDLKEGKLDEVGRRLTSIQLKQEQNPRYSAYIQRLWGRLFSERGDNEKAVSSWREAIDLFERVGMRRELAEAREELARLEAQMAKAAE